jgi:hypothetical protein
MAALLPELFPNFTFNRSINDNRLLGRTDRSVIEARAGQNV